MTADGRRLARLTWLALTMVAVLVYCTAAWAAAGGYEEPLIVLTIALIVVTSWKSSSVE